jgi:hypothetical protein
MLPNVQVSQLPKLRGQPVVLPLGTASTSRAAALKWVLRFAITLQFVK